MPNTNTPADCTTGEVKKDWRLLVDPLMAEMIDRLFPVVKGSLAVELGLPNRIEDAEGEEING